MLKQAAALSDAVRLRVVLKYGGQLCFVLSAFTLAPLEMQEPGADVEGGPHLRSTREVMGYNSARRNIVRVLGGSQNERVVAHFATGIDDACVLQASLSD